MAFTVTLADKIIAIENINSELEKFCKDYIVHDQKPDFTVSWTPEEILQEQKHFEEADFSMTYLETLAALRKISEQMPFHQRLLMHGASISYEGKGYLFTAPSGTGKSTHIRLWRKYLGNSIDIINGDKPFVSVESNAAYIYGSPWAGKERWQQNCRAPLAGICFLQRGATNEILRLDPQECLNLFFKQVYLPSNADASAATLELVDKLLKIVPLYILSCDMSEDAVRCSFETLTGKSYPNNK